MPRKLQEMEETIQDVYEGLSEQDTLSQNQHKTLGHVFLLMRNVAAAAAATLFLLSLFHVAHSGMLKAVAYFLGALAYLCDILITTDCFRKKVPHNEMFMEYCFGPLYILLGISYLTGH